MKDVSFAVIGGSALLRSFISQSLETAGLRPAFDSAKIEDLSPCADKSGVGIVLFCYIEHAHPGADELSALGLNFPKASFVLVGSSLEAESFRAEYLAGFRGWVHSGASAEELSAAVTVVLGGGLSMSGSASSGDFVSALLGGASGLCAAPYKLPRLSFGEIEFTEREVDVLTLLAEGASNKTISNVLYISENTAKSHVRSILEKLQLRSRTQAAVFAIEQGYGAQNRRRDDKD